MTVSSGNVNPVAADMAANAANYQADRTTAYNAYVAEQESKLARQRAAQEQRVLEQSQSWYGTLLDNFWMDDFQKGFVSPEATVFGVGVPGAAGIQGAWQEWGGDKVNAATTGITTGYNTWSQGWAYTLSGLPGGIDNLTWDQAASVSVGQVALANTSAFLAPVFAGLRDNTIGLAELALGDRFDPTAARQAADSFLKDYAPMFQEGWDITNPKDLQAASDSLTGKLLSGTADAVFMFYVDPLVIGGKATKVLRFGSEALGYGGLTKRKLTVAANMKWFETEGLAAEQYLADPLTKPKSVLNVHAETIARSNKEELRKSELFAGNDDEDMLTSLGALIDNDADALTFVMAIGGSPKGIAKLAAEQHAAFDAFNRSLKMADWQTQYLLSSPRLAAPIFSRIADELIDTEMLLDDLAQRNAALSDALGYVDSLQGTPALSNLGSKSVKYEEVKAAWRAGKAERGAKRLNRSDPEDLSTIRPEAETWVNRSDETDYLNVDKYLDEKRITADEAARIKAVQERHVGTTSAVQERVFQMSSWLRPVAVWSWVTGERASGYMTVRGIGVGDSVKELDAVLSDSKIIRNDLVFQAEMRQIWADAVTSQSAEVRMRAVSEIERRSAIRIAEEVGIDTKLMEEVYAYLDKARWTTVGAFRTNGAKRAYGKDPFSDTLIVADPVLSSQLETRVPMLDFAMLEKTAKLANRSVYRVEGAMVGEVAKNFLDEVASLWKASVLLRLGYTQRNVVEGWLRTAAVLGTIPALGAAPRGLARMVWSNRRYKVLGKAAPSRARAAARIADDQAAVASHLRAAREQRELTLNDWYAYAQRQPGAIPDASLAPELERRAAALEARRRPTPAEKQLAYNEARLRVEERMAARQGPRNQAHAAAQTYSRDRNLNTYDFDYFNVSVDQPKAASIADAYDALPVVDPAAAKAYKQLATEVEDQFKYLTETLGVKVEFVDVDPYRNSIEMYNDARQGVLKVYKTAADQSHPFLSRQQNDMFRAVHDYFGHFGTERGFGQVGEEAAWIAHSQMFSPLARRAMTTETRGQNSWYNVRNRNIPADQRRFATQKAALLPPQYSRLPRYVTNPTGRPNPALVRAEQRRILREEVIPNLPEGDKIAAGVERLRALAAETQSGNWVARDKNGLVTFGREKFEPVAVWHASPKARGVMRSHGITPQTFVEVPRSRAETFAKYAHAQVDTPYGVEDFRDMRLFLSPDGKSGFALAEGNKVVAVFDASADGAALKRFALEMGGRRSDEIGLRAAAAEPAPTGAPPVTVDDIPTRALSARGTQALDDIMSENASQDEIRSLWNEYFDPSDNPLAARYDDWTAAQYDETLDEVLAEVYRLTQESLQARGLPEMVTVWRTGSPSTNRGVVAVTLGDKPVASMRGEAVQYQIPRSRILSDAEAVRGAHNPSSVGRGTLTTQELEAHVNFADLRPVTREADEAATVATPVQPDWVDNYTATFAGALDPKMQQFKNLVRTSRDDESRLSKRYRELSVQRERYGKRSINREGAFAGPNAGVYKDLSSSQRTTERVLESKLGREAQQKMDETSWVLVKPGDSQYWTEVQRSVEQFRNDELAVLALEGKSRPEMLAWLVKDEGRAYASRMHLSKKEFQGRVATVHGMVHEYLPTRDARELAAMGARNAEGPLPSVDDLKVALQDPGIALSPVHGRAVAARFGTPATVNAMIHKPINWLFKILGTVPETVLVRQPFYNAVWQSRLAELQKFYRYHYGEGPLSSKTMQAMEQNAHAHAFRATNETLYTIQRYSNPAHLMRFIAPFFPAWENSIKVWAGIVWRDPSVAARASMLWQIPNKMGMVVDANGNPVESDPFAFGTGSIDRYIVMPQILTDAFKKVSESPLGKLPGDLGGVFRAMGEDGFRIPQGSLNVVSPGQTPWLPGFGPLVVAPAGLFLESKPDVQKFLRDTMGDAAYSQIAPFGVASADLMDTAAPPALRKFWQRWQGESNQEYLQAVDAMMRTAMIDWYKSGGKPEDRPDVDVIRQKANDFYLFSAFASLTLPFAISRTSKHQQYIDAWNNMKATPGGTYAEKVDAFLEKYGEAYIPIITSSSGSLSKDVDPTIETYRMMEGNRGLVEQLAMLGPEAIGIIGATAPLGQFDQGVYEYWLNTDIPGQPGDRYKATLSPLEMQQKIEMSKAWREYNAAKAERDAVLQARGGMSLQASVNRDIAAQWTDFTDRWMVQKYGATWSVAYNDYAKNQGLFLESVATVLNTPEFTGADTALWQQVRVYMETREQAIAAINNGANKEIVRDQFGQWAGAFRFTSLEFADFWDNYLANDDLSIGVSPIG